MIGRMIAAGLASPAIAGTAAGPAEAGGGPHCREALAVSPDGRLVAGGGAFDQGDEGQPTRVVLFDAATGKPVRTLADGPAAIQALAFAPDGRVRLWRAADGRGLASWNAKDGSILALGFTRDGRSLSAAGASGVVRLWDPATGVAQELPAR